MRENEWFEGKSEELSIMHDDDPKSTKLGVGLVLSLLAFIIIGVLVSGCAAGQTAEIPVYVYERDGLSLRLMPGPCVDPVSSFIIVQGLPRYASRFRAIESSWPMRDGTRKPFAGCWAELTAEEAQEAAFILVFEDRSRYVVSKKDLLAKPGGI